MRLPLYLTFNAFLAAALSIFVLGIFQKNSASSSALARGLDHRLDLLAREWTERETPSSQRTLTIFLFDSAAGADLLDPNSGREFGRSILSWARRKAAGRKPENYSEKFAPGGVVSDWSMESLQWASEKEKRMNDLTRYLLKAQQAHARINIVAQGFGVEMAVEAIKNAKASPLEIEKLVTLGESRARLKSSTDLAYYSDKPSHVKEWACLWSDGARPAGVAHNVYVEYMGPSGEWTRLPGEKLALAGSTGALDAEPDLLRAVREILKNDRTIVEFLVQSGAMKPTLTGKWKGRYFYPEKGADREKPPVDYEAAFSQTGGWFTGTITEPNTFGTHGVGDWTPTLRAVVLNGTVDDSGTVHFLKKYDGTGGAGHGVDYRGSLSTDGKTIVGVWATSVSYTGRFEMTKQAKGGP